MIFAHLLSRKWALQVALTVLCCLLQNIWRVPWINSFVLFHVNVDEGLLLWLPWEVVHMVTVWVFLASLSYFLFLFLFLHVCSSCLYVNHMCSVTARANRRHQIPQYWSYKPLWATKWKLGSKPQHSQRAETFNKRAIASAPWLFSQDIVHLCFN